MNQITVPFFPLTLYLCSCFHIYFGDNDGVQVQTVTWESKTGESTLQKRVKKK